MELDRHLPKGDLETLYTAIVALKTNEEVAAFLEDICTIKEIQAMSQRLKVAQLLVAGKNYQDIAIETGVSSATVSRVSRCLQYGAGGYRKFLGEEGTIKE